MIDKSQGNYYEEALKCCDEALKIDPAGVIGWFNKGTCLSGLNKHREALDCYDKGLYVVVTYYTYDDTLYYRLCCMFLENRGKSLSALYMEEKNKKVQDELRKEMKKNVNKLTEAMKHLGDLDSCESHLRNMAAAIELFFTDNKRYPKFLNELLKTPDGKGYLTKLPTCPAHGKSYLYEIKSNNNFILKCNDIHVKDTKKIIPAYYSDSGLNLRTSSVTSSTKETPQGMLMSCKNYLKKIATACEMYATDNKGNYPPSLDYLTKKIGNWAPYMESIPKCPACKKVYIYTGTNVGKSSTFRLECGGVNAHKDTGEVGQGHFPQYTPEKGIKLK